MTTFIENKFEAYLDNDDSPDISNPIHSTEIAQAYGFKGPLIGGVTVWGWSVDTILEALGPKWLEKGWSEFSFRYPTFPGDVLKITASKLPGKEDWNIKMTNQVNVVCVRLIGQVYSSPSDFGWIFISGWITRTCSDDVSGL